MADVNACGNALTGLTGTGNFVGSNTPTLITPVLGVATATSINFGGGALNTYIPLTAYTPTITFATPGDLSVTYTTQVGFYVQTGGVLYYRFLVAGTPTYTTASGACRVAGFPVTINATTSSNATGHGGPSSAFTWPVGGTSFYYSLTVNTTFCQPATVGSGITSASGAISVTQVPSGVAVGFFGSGFYYT